MKEGENMENSFKVRIEFFDEPSQVYQKTSKWNCSRLNTHIMNRLNKQGLNWKRITVTLEAK